LARIFITGSADGLGQAAARRLVTLGHEVVLHGRNRDRAQRALRAVPGARAALEGDLASIEQTRELARQANEAGPFQAVIHNAGVYRPGARRSDTVDGLDDVFAINALAPYLLTALIGSPQRLIYLTSGLHQGGDPESARPAVAPTALERISGVRQLKTVRCRAGLRRRPPLAARPLERGRSWMGSHEDGRCVRTRRPGARRRDPSVAGH